MFCRKILFQIGPKLYLISSYINSHKMVCYIYTGEPLLRGHPYERSPLLERPLDNVNFNNILISTPDERPPLLKGHFSDEKRMASQEGFH